MFPKRYFALVSVIALSLFPGIARGEDSIPRCPPLCRFVATPTSQTTEAGGLDIEVVWTAYVGEPTATVLNLSTEVQIQVGDYSAKKTVPVFANPGAGYCTDGTFGGPCGTGSVDGQNVTLLHLSEDGGSAQFPWITTRFPVVPEGMFDENDVIEVTLTPAAGSDQGSSTDGDFVVEPIVDRPTFYDRSFRSVDLEPIPGTTDLYDIVVEYQLAYNTSIPPVDFRTDLVMNLNGENMVFEPWCGPWITTPSSLCGQTCSNETCATIKCDGQTVATLTCQPYENAWGQFDCACVSGAIQYTIPSIQLSPSDRIELSLVGAPGALPEPAGLDDDSWVVCSIQAQSLPYGQGKAGTHGMPTLDSTALPILGQVSGIQMKEALPGARSLLIYGFQPLDIPFDGGRLLVDPAGMFVVPAPVAADGSLILERLLPVDPSLCGVSLFYQLMVRDPGAAGRFAMTNGLQRVLGF